MQQSTAGQTRVNTSINSKLHRLAKLAALAVWLPKHAGLVRSLAIDTSCGSDDTDAAEFISASLVGLSLQQVALGSAGRWKLRSFTGYGVTSPSLLSALPVAHLTELELELPQESEHSCLAAIRLLKNLRQLSFRLDSGKLISPGSVQHLASLSQLTMLYLGNVNSRSNFTALPQRLQRLELLLDTSEAPADLGLKHLTCLLQLHILCKKQPATPQQLPTQLQYLDAKLGQYSAISWFSIATLQHLQQLKLLESKDSVDDYKQLVGHPQLQRVELGSPSPEQFIKAAAVWKTVPNLASFVVSDCWVSASGLLRLAQHISLATSLTQLDLDIGVDSGQEADLQGRSACEHLKSLINLQHLGTWVGVAPTHWVASSGVQHLSALTGLKKLNISGGLPAVDETDAALLALKLTNLEYLALGNDDCNRGWSTAPLPVIGQLTRLQHLGLGEVSKDNAKRGLSCLVALTKLTHLHGFEAAGSNALEEFWATVKAPRRQ